MWLVRAPSKSPIAESSGSARSLIDVIDGLLMTKLL